MVTNIDNYKIKRNNSEEALTIEKSNAKGSIEMKLDLRKDGAYITIDSKNMGEIDISEFNEKVVVSSVSGDDDGKITDIESNATISVADELTKYTDLLEKGVLTKEEFDEQKKKLLK